MKKLKWLTKKEYQEKNKNSKFLPLPYCVYISFCNLYFGGGYEDYGDYGDGGDWSDWSEHYGCDLDFSEKGKT